MTELINVIYKLEVKSKTSAQSLIIEQFDENAGLAVDFEVKKTRTTAPNPAFFTIYNLDPEGLQLVAKRWKPSYEEGSTIVFSVGFRGLESWNIVSPVQIYEGEIRSAVSHLEGPTRVTKINAGTEWSTLKNKVSFALDGKNTGDMALSAIIAKIGKPQQILNQALAFIKKKFFNGRSFSTNIQAILNEFGKSLGINIDVQKSAIKVSLPGEADPMKPEIFLNEKSGLIGEPEVTNKGVKLKVVLQPEVEPGCKINLESESLEKTYGTIFTAEEIIYSGNTYSGEAMMDIDAYTPGRFS
jgi:hypothetical protein